MAGKEKEGIFLISLMMLINFYFGFAIFNKNLKFYKLISNHF